MSKITEKEAISLLSSLELDTEGNNLQINTWYNGIYDDLKEAIKMAVELLSDKYIRIPKSTITNGDLIKMIYPEAEVELDGLTVKVKLDRTLDQSFNYCWWHAPYMPYKKDRCAFCAEQFDLFCAKAKRSIDFNTFWNHPPYKPDWCPGRTPTEEFHD